MNDKRWTVEEYVKRLKTFVSSFYFENGGLFTLKMVLFHLALKRIPTGKIVYEVGRGGDGKGCEAILDRNVLGDENFTTIDCAVFTDRSEFRRSAGFA